MPADELTPSEPLRPSSSRWPREDITDTLDNFSHSEQPSQRQFAQQQSIPHATFNYFYCNRFLDLKLSTCV